MQDLTVSIGPGVPCIVLTNVESQDGKPTATLVYDYSERSLFDHWTPTQRAVWAARLRTIADLIEGAGDSGHIFGVD